MGVAEEPVHFSGNLTLPNRQLLEERWDDRISFSLDYNGNDDYSPIQNDQVFLLSSSVDHPSRIEFRMDHVEAEFDGPVFDFDNEQVIFNVTVGSAFGGVAIKNNSWSFSIQGNLTKFEAASFCTPKAAEVATGYEIRFCWKYNLDDTPTDLFKASVDFEDIQDNSYHLENENSFPLIYTSNLNINNKLSRDGIMVNGNAFIEKVVVDESVKISAKIEADGDSTDGNNPVEYLFYVKKAGNGTEILLKRDVIIHLPIGESEVVQTNWKPKDTGTYTLRIELDKSNYTQETNENDNGAELILKVIDEEETILESFLNTLEDDQLAQALFVTLIGATIAIVVMAIVLKRRGGRYRIGQADDEDWDDDF